jgi:ABC-type lipoprotein export system ATPase subunit
MVDQGKTILMVTHDEDLAHQVRRMITIADGQIVDQEYFDRNAAALTNGTDGASADEPNTASPSEPVPTPQEAPV